MSRVRSSIYPFSFIQPIYIHFISRIISVRMNVMGLQMDIHYQKKCMVCSIKATLTSNYIVHLC